MRRRALLLAAPWLAAADGYRMEDYRAPVPDGVPGGRAIDTAEAAAIFARHDATWIDVLAAPRRPASLPQDALWRPSPHLGIPGSLWLPEVGRGVLSAETEAWFRVALHRATHGEHDHAVVFYCLADCWMSWNATKRAAEWGWRKVLWYRDGMDGWEAAGLPTEELHPAPGWR